MIYNFDLVNLKVGENQGNLEWESSVEIMESQQMENHSNEVGPVLGSREMDIIWPASEVWTLDKEKDSGPSSKEDVGTPIMKRGPDSDSTKEAIGPHNKEGTDQRSTRTGPITAHAGAVTGSQADQSDKRDPLQAPINSHDKKPTF